MRNRAVLVLGLLLFAGAVWMRAGNSRQAGRAVPGSAEAEEPAARQRSELRSVIAPDEATSAADASRSTAPTTAGTSSAPLRAVIRGQVVMADTLEPLERVLSIRLRSIDLRLIDSVETSANGSFASRRTFPESGVLARVSTAEGRELVDYEAPFDPSATEPWLVRVPGSEFPTSVYGRVIDLSGEPVSDAEVYCARLAPIQPGPDASAGQPIPEEPWVGEVDEDGSFEIDGLAPGNWELQAVGRHARGSLRTIELSRGATDVGDLVLPSPGALCGRLVADGEPRAYFVLRELATGRELSSQEEPFHDDLPEGIHSFRLSGLPPGDYELSLVPADGRSYEPASLRVRPPASGLEFRAVSGARAKELSVRDSKSGETLSHEAFTRVRGRWLDGFLSQGERWLVWADGYRPASLEPSALATVDETARVTVLLEQGWGQLRLYQTNAVDLVFDRAGKWSRPPLSGVQVRADGLAAATSDEDGIALVSRERAPERVEEWLAGWSTSSSYTWRGMVVVKMTRE